jgi:hypothetical protein
MPTNLDFCVIKLTVRAIGAQLIILNKCTRFTDNPDNYYFSLSKNVIETQCLQIFCGRPKIKKSKQTKENYNITLSSYWMLFEPSSWDTTLADEKLTINHIK